MCKIQREAENEGLRRAKNASTRPSAANAKGRVRVVVVEPILQVVGNDRFLGLCCF